jgi:hypothetical protein
MFVSFTTGLMWPLVIGMAWYLKGPVAEQLILRLNFDKTALMPRIKRSPA